MNYHDFYSENALYQEYVDKFAKSNKITVDDALRMSIPQFVAEYIKDKEAGKIESNMVAGCGGATGVH